ncbi:MAG TPA: hypothetical protein VN238_21820 [Solirubrobacteraceae bacterium]|nr:hypothetical protein [Solirubrobacteraceae bacterium]
MDVFAASTQHEATALGHRRARDRAEGRTIGRGARITAFQQTMIFWPTFAFAGMAAPTRTPAERETVAPVLDACERLYRTEAFIDFSACVRPHLRRGWTFTSVLAAVRDEAPDVLVALHLEIKGCERDLRERGLGIESRLGRVIHVAGDVVVISGKDEIRRRLTPVNVRHLDLRPDMWVVRERVSLRGHSGELLLPAVAPTALPDLPVSAADDDLPAAAGGEDAAMAEPSQRVLAVRPANALASNLVRAFATENVAKDWTSMWGRGEGRVYADAREAMSGTVPDDEVALTHRRAGSETW